MKRWLCEILMIFCFVVVPDSAVHGQDIKDDADAQNYTIGYQFGEELRGYDLAIQPDIIWHGLFNLIDGIPAQFDLEQMRTSLDILEEELELKDNSNDKTNWPEIQNYSLGYQLSGELIDYGIPIRPQMLWDGIFDAYGQADPELSNEQMNAVLVELTQLLVQRQKPPLRLKGHQFLAENMEKEDVTILASGLQYKVMKSGNGKTPQASDRVLVHYRARTIEGQEFDHSYPQGIPTPKEFQVNKVLPGWTEALLKMQEGDKWELYIPSYLSYRDSGPMAGQTIIVELELLEILPKYQ